LVYTAFSGSHQDAVKKGFEAQAVRHAAAEKTGDLKIWDIPYLPIDPADLGRSYEAVIRVNSQSGKGGISFLVKQHLGLDMPRKMQVSFYAIIQDIADREAREVTVDDITSAFRRSYYFGGPNYHGRLILKSFRISSEPSSDLETTNGEPVDEIRRFDGTLYVDGVLRILRGDGNGPLSALLNALKVHLDVDLTIREYSEHTLGDGHEAKAASYIELVPSTDRKSGESWWGVGVDSDIAGSGLRAVLSAVNQFIPGRPLPELKLSVGFGARSGQTDVASAIMNALQLELPRRLQASFFEVVQRTSQDSGGEISYTALVELFQKTYKYGGPKGRFSMSSFKMQDMEDETRRSIVGELQIEGRTLLVFGEGNGPLSAILDALNSQIESGTLAVREYSEHSIGEGSDVRAVSFVELLYEFVKCDGGKDRATSWGVAADTDITASGLKATLCAASELELVFKK
jgi:2-isopropylmalate synthase